MLDAHLPSETDYNATKRKNNFQKDSKATKIYIIKHYFWQHLVPILLLFKLLDHRFEQIERFLVCVRSFTGYSLRR